jgi:hypothetical protein
LPLASKTRNPLRKSHCYLSFLYTLPQMSAFTATRTSASAKHAEAGPRAGAPFAEFDSSAVAPALIESELFGHERGAFTGAIARHVGVFDHAEGGTLRFDEIGELDLSLQPKLLTNASRTWTCIQVRTAAPRIVAHVGVSGEGTSCFELDDAVLYEVPVGGVHAECLCPSATARAAGQARAPRTQVPQSSALAATRARASCARGPRRCIAAPW